MKAWMNKLGGVLLASLLTVMLNGKAYANNEGTSEPPATEIHESTEAPAAPAVAPASAVAEAPSPAPAEAPAPAAPVAAPVAPVVPAAAPVAAEAAPVEAPAPAPAPAPAASVVVEAPPAAAQAAPAVAAAAPAAAEITPTVTPAEPVTAETPAAVEVPAATTTVKTSAVIEIPAAEIPDAEPVAKAPAASAAPETSVADTPTVETPAAGTVIAEATVPAADVPDEDPIEDPEVPASELENSAEAGIPDAESGDADEEPSGAEEHALAAAEDNTKDLSDALAVTALDAVPLRSMRLMSAAPASLGTSAQDATSGSKSGGTDPEEKDPEEKDQEDKQPEGKAPEESNADDTVPVVMKSATRSGSSSASVFSRNEDGSYVLVNHEGTETLSGDGDVTINAAGLNHLGAISVNGNINLVGTGILLVDKIEMAEGKGFYLQPNKEIYGENGGSVAVFLKQDNGDYLLINGSVDGILDEEYEIPANVTLVVPGGSRLVMQSVAVIEYPSSEGEQKILYSLEGEQEAAEQLPDNVNSESVDYRSTSPKLTILEKAKLVIQEQAALIMNGISLHVFGKEVPTLNVQGTLELGGTVKSNNIGGIVESNGMVTGTGRICDTDIYVRSDQTALTVENAQVNVFRKTGDTGTGQNTALSIGTLTAYGSNNLVFKDSNIAKLDLRNGAEVIAEGYSIRLLDEPDYLLTLGEISGRGTMVYGHRSFSVGTVGGTVEEKLFTREPLIRGDITYVAGSEGMVAVPTQSQTGSIPVVNIDYSIMRSAVAANYDIKIEKSSLNNPSSISLADATVSYGDLVKKFHLVPETPGPSSFTTSYIEVYIAGTGGKIEMTRLFLSNSTDTTLIETADILMIRTVKYFEGTNTAGGSTSTSTNTAFTGSGILGGSGAGSLSGGNSRMILFRKASQKDEPVPIPVPDPIPEPDPALLVATVEEPQVEAPLVWVELAPAASNDSASPEETQYVLLALEGEKTLEELGGKATVAMNYTPPAEYTGKTLYVVFRNEDGTLTAIHATYSDITGLLRFITDRLGTFMVVGFDFEGKEFSEEFYEALSKLPVLENLVFAEYSPV